MLFGDRLIGTDRYIDTNFRKLSHISHRQVPLSPVSQGQTLGKISLFSITLVPIKITRFYPCDILMGICHANNTMLIFLLHAAHKIVLSHPKHICDQVTSSSLK